jgi:formylmethanofuran dehydrogenase subunit E
MQNLRECRICAEYLKEGEKGLQSIKDGHWICKPCFEIKLGHKI